MMLDSICTNPLLMHAPSPPLHPKGVYFTACLPYRGTLMGSQVVSHFTTNQELRSTSHQIQPGIPQTWQKL